MFLSMDTDPEDDALALRARIALLERQLEGQAAELLLARTEHRQLEQELYDAQVALAAKEARAGPNASRSADTKTDPSSGPGRIARAIAGRRRH